MKKCKPITAFTLVEILVATSIFSIVILSIYSAFHTGILSYRKIDSASAVYQAARVILNRMESDLKNSFAYAKDDAHFKATKEFLDFFTIVDSYDREGKVSTNLCRVKYELNAQGQLIRIISYGADALKEDLNVEGDELSSDIKEIILQYTYKTDDPDNPLIWKNDNSEYKERLPLAVKIELTLLEKDRNTALPVKFTKIVSLVR